MPYTTEPFIFAIPTIRLCEKVQKRESEAKTYQLDVTCTGSLVLPVVATTTQRSTTATRRS